MPQRFPLHTIGILTKPHRSSEVRQLLADLLPWFKERKIIALMDREATLSLGNGPWETYDRETIAKRADLVIVLGGDGTILSAARLMVSSDIPILGVNLGTLGFLAEVPREETFRVLESVLQGYFVIEKRMMIHGRVIRNNQEVILEEDVLNDVVINKGTIARMIEVEVFSNTHFVTDMKGDGVIFSTATGSTAYSMAAGGPILHPESDGIVMTPICPHTLTQRPIVFPGTVLLEALFKKGDANVVVTFDGQISAPLNKGDVLQISRSKSVTSLLVSPDRNYFEVLRDKLRWGGA
jgi:NAD+ kinase